MKKGNVYFNGRFYTQAVGAPVANSMAVSGHTIMAVGKNLEKDGDFAIYDKVDLKGCTVIPGLVDSHTHFYFLVISLGNVKLDGSRTLDEVLQKIKRHAARLGRNEWVIGEGFSPDQWRTYIRPDRHMLDRISGDRPAAIFSKDTHTMWANSRALELGQISKSTPEPSGGHIDRLDNGEPSGLLGEIPAYFPVFRMIERPDKTKTARLWNKALDNIYSRGVTGVHSFDGPEALPFFLELAASKKLGLKVDYYPPNKMLGDLAKSGIRYGYGDDFLRICGTKLFADGALGSQTALCFQKYLGSKDNYGIEVTSKKEMLELIRKATRLSLPCAIHAIGDKAISNVLGCFEKAPAPLTGLRHRIEHLQMIRPSDIARVKKLGIVASMQPTHCPSDVKMIEKYWGKRGRNCYVFRTLIDRGIPLAFGSDAPIEPLDPIMGIHAAVNRFLPGTSKSFYPEQRISPAEAIFRYTVGPAYAVGQEFERGYLLPGYKADFVVLADDIYHLPRTKIRDIRVWATILNGRPVFRHKDSRLSF